MGYKYGLPVVLGHRERSYLKVIYLLYSCPLLSFLRLANDTKCHHSLDAYPYHSLNLRKAQVSLSELDTYFRWNTKPNNMYTSITTFLAASAAVVSAGAIPARRAETASITPHDQYSSSIGVVGCKINTDRVAYWPSSVDCDNICVKVSNAGRSVHLLKIDQSGGAYDISYDAWNYLGFGSSAKDDPQQGGGISMEYEYVDASECSDLLEDGKLPLTAANSMNYVSSCLSQPDSWVAKNHELINIIDPVCHWGYDEVCSLDLSVSNQPSCPHTLGLTVALDPAEPVYNIQYGTGKEVVA